MLKITKKRFDKYIEIYKQISKNPLISRSKIIQKTGIANNTIIKYVAEMKDLSIMFGPVIFLKPARNYTEYAYFLQVKDFAVRKQLTKSVTLLGKWNTFFIRDACINYTELKGYKTCFLQGIKGVTYFSHVNALDWDTTFHRIQTIPRPAKKSFLYEKVHEIPWDHKEWALYKEFKYNVRRPVDPVLKKVGATRRQYRKWLSSLPDYAEIQTAFYPLGLDTYVPSDVLFKSEYQKHLGEVLGVLPTSTLFFSVGDYVFARLFLPCELSAKVLMVITDTTGEFFTEAHSVMVAGGPKSLVLV